MFSSLWRLPTIFGLTLGLSLVGGFSAAVMRVILYESFADPLTIVVLGLVAGPVAFWTQALLPHGHGRGESLTTFGITLGVAGLLAILRVSATTTEIIPRFWPDVRTGGQLLFWAAVVALAATLASQAFHSGSRRSWRPDATLSLGLLAAVPITIAATIAVASWLGKAGA